MLLLLLWIPLDASPIHENRLLYVHSCSISPREILVVTNMLDLYTMDWAAIRG